MALDIAGGGAPPGSPPSLGAIGTPDVEPVTLRLPAATQQSPGPGTGPAGFNHSVQLRPEVVDMVFATSRRRPPAVRPVWGLTKDLLGWLALVPEVHTLGSA